MSENRKTAPGVTSTESGRVDQAAFHGTTVSISDYSIGPGSVASVLLTGKGCSAQNRGITQRGKGERKT